MAHYDLLFPPDISTGVVGGPKFQNVAVTTGSGWTSVNQDWQDPLREYDCEHLFEVDAERDLLLSWFHIMGGTAHTFLFLDYSDGLCGCVFDNDDWTEVSRQLIGEGDGVEDEFQLIKTYEIATGVTYDRVITKPAGQQDLDPVSNPKIYVNNVLQVEDTDYELDYSTGIVTFLPGHIPAVGHDIEWVGPFYVKVRFRVDTAKIMLNGEGSGSWAGIGLIEDREDI